MLLTMENKNDKPWVEFYCLEATPCFSNLNLGGKIDDAVSSLDAAFYQNANQIYITLWAGSSHIVVYNPTTGTATTHDLNADIDLQLSNLYVDGRVIYSTTRGQVFIIEGDSVKRLQLNISPTEQITRLAELADNRIAAINGIPVEKNGKKFVKIFVIDVLSATAIEKHIPIKNERQQSGMFVNVSKDLQTLYYITFAPTNNREMSMALEIFDVNRESVLATNSNLQCINFMNGYFQYHGFLYSNYYPEGGGTATLINATSLEPLIVPTELLKDSPSSKVLIVPFGDTFLIGTDTQVIRVSQQDGAIVARYPLPQNLVGKEYVIMAYHNK